MKSIFVFIIFCFFFNACVFNATNGEPNMCELHGKKMHKSFVKAVYGKTYVAPNTAAYPNARKKLNQGCVIYDRKYKYAVVWTCSACTKLKRKGRKERNKVIFLFQKEES
ncbi:MAG: hypothetical protein ACTHJT_01240 [Cytophaga sp.]|uniref:hypothetical protein n=1 Tax=Cytophaga sp. TaxID=29535 RepID=UPI003F81C974